MQFHSPVNLVTGSVREVMITGTGLPVTLVDAVETFKTAMLATDRGVKNRKLAEDTAQSHVTAACDSPGVFSRSRFGAAPVRLQVESAGVDLFGFCRKP